MPLIEALAQAHQGNAEPLSETVDQVFHTVSSHEEISEKFLANEREIYKMMGALLANRAVIMSAVYRPLDWASMHYGQVDIFRPIIIVAGDETSPQLNCYPFKEFGSIFTIVGKREQMHQGRVRPVSGIDRRTYDMSTNQPVREERYGFALSTDDPITMVNAGRSRMTLSPNEHTTIISRGHPLDSGMRTVIDEKHTEDQALFKSFAEELLLHEGHAPVQVTVWQ